MKLSNRPEHLKTGALGEDLARDYLEKRGFTLVGRNYRKKWGEIDLIMQKDATVHFVEVKTVSYETVSELKEAISRGTFKPEDRVSRNKLARLRRTIETWIAEKREDRAFQLDIATVRMVPREKYAVVDVIENIEVL